MSSFGARFPWPKFDADEVAAASRVLESGKVNYWTGEEGKSFEREFAEFARTRHAIALSNGTVSLEVAALALGLGPGDEFITSPRTFVGTASGLIMRGLRPVFADVDLDSGNLTPESVDAAWTSKTKLVVPVHLGGWPCDVPGINDLARARGAFVMEDCAQAHGAKLGGRSVGSMGDVGSWSFCQDKIITTGGEGGMLTLNDDALFRTMWSLKDHGKSYEAVYERPHPPGFRWLHESWGSNFRLTEFQAAIGRIQLRKLPEWTAARRRNANVLAGRLSSEALRIPTPPDDVEHAYYRVYAYVNEGSLRDGWCRDRIMEEVQALGFPCFVGSCGEIYREKAFASAGFSVPALPNAQTLANTSLAFLVQPTIPESAMHQVADAIESVMIRATK